MKTRIATGPAERVLLFWCPGCDSPHGPRIEGERPWTWNGDRERPTLHPSILCTGKRRLSEDEYQRIVNGEQLEIPDQRCHSFVRDGQIEFLGDCTHALAGRTVPIPEWPRPDFGGVDPE